MWEFIKKLFAWLLGPEEPLPDDPDEEPDIVVLLLDAHNAERAKHGSLPLLLHPQLTDAATLHCWWMAERKKLSHTGDDGEDHVRRMIEAGYSPTASGENIAAGFSSVASVMKAWMGSHGHARNVLSATFDDAGFAEHEGYWCAVFGTKSQDERKHRQHDVTGRHIETEPLTQAR